MTLYAIRPHPETGSVEADDAEVIDQLPHGWAMLEQAVTIWRLVDEPRAAAIALMMADASIAAGDGELRFSTEELGALVALLAGMEEALVAAGILDRSWRAPAERLASLATVVTTMDLRAERPLDDKTFALGEVLSRAIAARNFLARALDAACVVVVG
ncbi:MAG TPA: hypothetical protein VFP84_23130 [Kofleriaceae bacterium]|nr:hypothetical protein [Kofleriaceae bacterium]